MKPTKPAFIPKESPLTLAIAVYQLLGGLLGLGFFLKMIPHLQDPSPSTWFGIGLAAVLYTFSILCGFLLFKQTRRAFTLSIVNQGLQVLGFGMPGFAYHYVAGLRLGVGIDFLDSWVFKFRVALSSFQFTVGAPAGSSFVAVNVLALVVLYLLETGREKSTN